MLFDVLSDTVGPLNVFRDGDIQPQYFSDQSFGCSGAFDILVKPASVEEVSGVVRLCNEYNVPVTPRGGGTGVTGGAIPARRGIVLSLERLNRVISIDKRNRYAIVESGTITKDFCSMVEQHGMYFPVNPGSMAKSFIGGNIAENAAGIRSCAYGTFVEFVMNLEVVLPSGEIIWTGANVHKNATGFNLTKLFVGSEGVLGIITKAVIKILPKPAVNKVLVISFMSLAEACRAVLDLSMISPVACAVELVTRSAIELAAPFLPANYPFLATDPEAFLILEWEGSSNAAIESAITSAFDVLDKIGTVRVFVAKTAEEADLIWSIRRVMGDAMVSDNWVYRDIDAVVPPSALHEYLGMLDVIKLKYGVRLICFGHAMDGNLHTMLLLSRDKIALEGDIIDPVLSEIYTAAVQLGGTISGEHGIGSLQQAYLPIQFNEKRLDIMRRIKVAFDPLNILNPGKLMLDS
jgi:glycolate oxidase